jgi:long-chain acyl-CoA synthetase
VAELFNSPELKKAVMASLAEIATSSQFKPIEFVQGIYLCPEEWTPENELLTAAMKIKRQDIYKKYKAELNAIYASLKA